MPQIPESKDTIGGFNESLTSLLEEFGLLATSLSQSIISMIVKRCEETLLIVQSIPSQYRMTNRDVSFFLKFLNIQVSNYFKHVSMPRSLYIRLHSFTIFFSPCLYVFDSVRISLTPRFKMVGAFVFVNQ